LIDRGYIFIWPLYFDVERSRKEGRKVARKLAVSNPTAEKVAQALRKLGYNPLILKEKNHPADWFNYRGLVLLKKDDLKVPKSKLLKEIGNVLRKL